MRVFEENQKFTQTWLMVIVGICILLPLIFIFKEWSEKTDKSFQNNIDLILTVGIVFLAITPLLIIKLKTRIDDKGVHYQFFPFHLKYRVLNWKDIDKVFVRKYSPISEYGGWGYRNNFFNKNKGVAYSVSGSVGIQIILKTGKKILLGTNAEEKAKQAINYNLKFTSNE